MTSRAVSAFVLVAAAACQRDAEAQAVERDPLGPVRCFEITTGLQLSDQSAVELCAGQPTDGPGRCFAVGLDLAGQLSEQQLLQLCSAASSVGPINCYLRLDAEETLTDQQLIDYCQTTCPVGPAPPQASSPACLAAALEDTELTLESAAELCVNSSSAGPVACYLAADDLEALSDNQLVELCAVQFQCQYFNAAPTGGYARPGGY